MLSTRFVRGSAFVLLIALLFFLFWQPGALTPATTLKPAAEVPELAPFCHPPERRGRAGSASVDG